MEGSEVSVLRSLGSLLSPSKFPIIVAEYGPEGLRVAGVTGWDLVKLMKDAGYRCTDLHSNAAIINEEDVPLIADYWTTDFLFRPS